MNVQPRMVLLVEDEETITVPLTEALAREGFRTETAGSLAAGLEIARSQRPDLVLLDVMLPDGSGFDLLRELRADERMPVIMLTARGDEADRVLGLELGADDYVVKPFSARELVARIRAVLRRTSAVATPAADGVQQIGAIELDPSARTVTLDGEPLELTRKEFDLLALLMGQAGHRRQPRAAHRRGLGRQLVRLDQDARRPRQRAAQEARRRLLRSPLPAHGARRGLPLRARRGARRAMSLRLRLVLAFGYVLLFAIIALEVPLTLNFSRRVDSEIKAEASAGAQARRRGRLGAAHRSGPRWPRWRASRRGAWAGA